VTTSPMARFIATPNGTATSNHEPDCVFVFMGTTLRPPIALRKKSVAQPSGEPECPNSLGHLHWLFSAPCEGWKVRGACL
jgi:hypothetical protein